MITLAQAFANWNEDIRPMVVEMFGENDDPAMSESWNDYTDSLCKDGELCALQYHYCPSYDDAMPDEGSRFSELNGDRVFILDAMGVRMTSKRVPSRTLAEQWSADASHWRVTIKRNGKRMTVSYSMGSAHTGSPDECDVLNCLLSDASCVEDGFADWCGNMDMDTDSRKALNMFRACKRTAASLARLFTASELADLRELFEGY